MLMPSIFGNSFMDDFFSFPETRFTKPMNNTGLMKTDITETDGGFNLDMELPGYKKEDVQAELKDGYLIINASKNESRDETDANGKCIRKERYSGSCSRSFYVGDVVTQEDITAKFEDGILKLFVPKIEKKPEIEEKKYVTIN